MQGQWGFGRLAVPLLMARAALGWRCPGRRAAGQEIPGMAGTDPAGRGLRGQEIPGTAASMLFPKLPAPPLRHLRFGPAQPGRTARLPSRGVLQGSGPVEGHPGPVRARPSVSAPCLAGRPGGDKWPNGVKPVLTMTWGRRGAGWRVAVLIYKKGEM